jgi:preprotein translocase subunit YajC
LISLQEGKKVHTGGGFSGKGFKFDEAEAMMVSEKKKFQKAALGNTSLLYLLYTHFGSL